MQSVSIHATIDASEDIPVFDSGFFNKTSDFLKQSKRKKLLAEMSKVTYKSNYKYNDKISKQDVYSEMKGLSSLISLTLFLAMSYTVQNVSFEPLVWKTRVNLSLL